MLCINVNKEFKKETFLIRFGNIKFSTNSSNSVFFLHMLCYETIYSILLIPKQAKPVYIYSRPITLPPG